MILSNVWILCYKSNMDALKHIDLFKRKCLKVKNKEKKLFMLCDTKAEAPITILWNSLNKFNQTWWTRTNLITSPYLAGLHHAAYIMHDRLSSLVNTLSRLCHCWKLLKVKVKSNLLDGRQVGNGGGSGEQMWLINHISYRRLSNLSRYIHLEIFDEIFIFQFNFVLYWL